MLKKILPFLLLLSVGFVHLSCEAEETVPLQHISINGTDYPSLQRGAKHFINYCVTCHGAKFVRYDLLKQIGLSKQQIEENLILTGSKISDDMVVAFSAKDATEWFGVAPPDLSVEARVRGADWLYSYLKGFYKDDTRPSGWNNVVFPNVAMPHVLYALQGTQVIGPTKDIQHLALTDLVVEKPGKLTPAEYNQFIYDLVNYMAFMAEPARETRIHMGYGVIIFLILGFALSYALKKEYWKDIH
ncbi:MAG: cytochrome c1 [Betaproteobacteria bacterium]|nr:cytochrome c1 [Betaproteobacteria bacterium]MDE2423377.1 cytochrome c1 [Betaproteobacteria bacterium]